MSSTQADPRLDRTTAWVSTLIFIVVMSVIGSIAGTLWYGRYIEADLVKAGFCQVENVPHQPINGYHWERCK